MSNMGSAHSLVEVNVSFKFEGNPSISKEVIEQTRIGDAPTPSPKQDGQMGISSKDTLRSTFLSSYNVEMPQMTRSCCCLMVICHTSRLTSLDETEKTTSS